MLSKARKIFLLGGGFSDAEHTEFDEILLAAVDNKNPRVCFIPTASGDSRDYIERFYSAFSGYECVPSHLELFQRQERDLDSMLAQQDVVYVGGGNTSNLLALWRVHGLDESIKRAYERGLILAGISAGAACWFEECLTDSYGGLHPLHDGLGLLKGSFCPHYNSELDRADVYGSLIDSGQMMPGFALDDGAAARFEDERLAEIYQSNPGSTLCSIERTTT